MLRFETAAGRIHAVLVLAVVMALPSACTTDDAGPATATSNSATARPTSSPAVTTNEIANCTNTEVHQLVTRFVQAFDTGDQPALERLWAQSGQGFEWYSTDSPGQRIDPAARSRATLSDYFAKRHTHRETLRLTSFQFNGNAASYGNFQYALIRQADELSPTAYVGKGAALCASMPPTLGVWSMAKDPQTSTTS